MLEPGLGEAPAAAAAAAAASMERERSLSQASLLSAPPPPGARTIYSYAPSTAPSFDSSSVGGGPSQGYPSGMPGPYAGPSTPCTCAECMGQPAWASQPVGGPALVPVYASGYEAAAGMPYGAEAYPPAQQAYPPAAPRHAARAYYAYQPPPLPPPPLPAASQFSYTDQRQQPPPPQPTASTWAGPSTASPSSFASVPPPRSREPSYQQPSTYEYHDQVPSPYYQLPSALQPAAPTLDRRRSSGTSTSRVSVGRRPSGTSGGSPNGSDHSGGSDGGLEERTTTPFMTKLHYLLHNPDFSEFIRWSADGRSFVFAPGSKALSEALALVFRHGNAHSFVRQLNIYSFKRLPALELHTAVTSVPHPHSDLTSADFSGFHHPLFYRDTPGNPCDLTRLRPKMGKKSSAKNLASSQASSSSSSASRSRALRSEGKVGGGMAGRKA